MFNSSSNNKKNILEFKLTKLRKKEKNHNIYFNKLNQPDILLFKDSKFLEEIEITNKINNIKSSVQRINQLIDELKQISDKPNK